MSNEWLYLQSCLKVFGCAPVSDVGARLSKRAAKQRTREGYSDLVTIKD